MENINDIFRIMELCRTMKIGLKIEPEYKDCVSITLSMNDHHLKYTFNDTMISEVINYDLVDYAPNSSQFMEGFIKDFISKAMGGELNNG